MSRPHQVNPGTLSGGNKTKGQLKSLFREMTLECITGHR